MRHADGGGADDSMNFHSQRQSLVGFNDNLIEENMRDNTGDQQDITPSLAPE